MHSNTYVILVLVGLCLSGVTAATVEPIWLSPTKIQYGSTIPLAENFTAAGLGEWFTSDVGSGSRGNLPGALMDSKGILWIFGGRDATDNPDLSGMWSYNPKTDQYRYVRDTMTSRNQGTIGIPSLENNPGPLFGSFFSATIDNNDNIWFTYFGELWMFSTYSWKATRVQGLQGTTSDSPSFGANPGQPGEDVWPGYTAGPCFVTDSQNNLWLLGGSTGNTSPVKNTVWHFNTTSKQWSFVHGDRIPGDQNQNSTFLGGFFGGGCNVDENDRVWLYGGYSHIPEGEGDYGNIWTFDTRVKRVWEFEWGADDTFKRPAQVVSDDYHPDNHPPASESSLFIDRLDGTLLLVNGGGYVPTYGATNTMWLYKKSLKQWKLIYGQINVLEAAGAFTNYREPGSTYPGTSDFGQHAGKNFNGDVFIVNGGSYAATPRWRNELWLIPQDQCSLGIAKCSVNATCIEEMVGYSCECNGGLVGDGFTCAEPPPVAPPSSDTPSSSGSPSSSSPSSSGPAATPKNNLTSTGSLLVVSSAIVVLNLLGLIINGGSYAATPRWRNEIWLIPQDQCSLGIAKCSAEATCVEEMVGYSWECNEGLVGDGFTVRRTSAKWSLLNEHGCSLVCLTSLCGVKSCSLFNFVEAFNTNAS